MQPINYHFYLLELLTLKFILHNPDKKGQLKRDDSAQVSISSVVFHERSLHHDIRAFSMSMFF